MAGKSAVISVIVTGEASGAKKAFEQGEKAAEGFRKEVEKAEKGFEGLRDGADNTERRIIGFKDSLTGTSDIMGGIRSGNMEQMAQGFADMASSVANLGADLLDWGKKALEGGLNAAKGAAASTAAVVKDTAASVAHKAATVASTIATNAQAGAQWALNAAMNANPVLLVVVAIAALTAAFILAWKHSETFREIVTGAFDAVKSFAEGAFNWFRDNWPLLLGILTGPFGLAVLTISRHWDDIKDAATTAKNWISDRIDDIVGFVTGMPDRIKTAASGMFDGIKDAFKAALNAIISMWNDFHIPQITIGWDAVKVAGKTVIPGAHASFGPFDFPDIPMLAQGGIVTGPTLGLIGEAGPEAIVPLSRAGSMGIGGTQIIIQGDVYGEADFLRKLENAIVTLKRKGSRAVG